MYDEPLKYVTLQADHAAMVAALAKPGGEIQQEMTPEDAHLVHMVLGISGEAGELLDAVKKAVIYRKPLDRKNLIEELGDMEFYLQGLRAELGITRSEVLQANIDKLSIRYPTGAFTQADAIARADKAGGA